MNSFALVHCDFTVKHVVDLGDTSITESSTLSHNSTRLNSDVILTILNFGSSVKMFIRLVFGFHLLNLFQH